MAWNFGTRRAAWRDSWETTLVPNSKYRSKQFTWNSLARFLCTSIRSHWIIRFIWCCLNMFSLNSLDSLNLLYSFQSPSFFVCRTYYIVYICLCFCHTSRYQIFYLLLNISNHDLWVKKYIHNHKTLSRTLNPSNNTGQCCQLECQFC